MKKLLLIALLVCAFGVMNAQDFKALKGDVTTDFSLFNRGILSENAPVELNNGMLKGRYFLMDDLALRGSFSLYNHTIKDTSVKDETKTKKDSRFAFGLGAEKHFAGTDRLSPYVGAELTLSFQSGKQTIDAKDKDYAELKNPSRFGIGANLLFGADYYIAKRVYMGVEAGLSFLHESVGASSEKIGGNITTGEKKGTSLGINTNLFAGFKLGYAF